MEEFVRGGCICIRGNIGDSLRVVRFRTHLVRALHAGGEHFFESARVAALCGVFPGAHGDCLHPGAAVRAGLWFAAAKSERAAKIMLPLLDILQSIPVLSFLPGVMLAMVALFPRRQLGLELGSILLIFTGQAWNIAFSFYASLKGIPRELDEAARLYRFSKWQRFTELELPFAAIGLVWNSMMSVAGGWFFLMACEMFVLGHARFPVAGARFLFADRRRGRRYARHPVGNGGDDRGHRPAGSTGLAAGDCLVGQIQIRDGGGRGSAVVCADRAAQIRILAAFYRSAIYPVEERLTRAFALKKAAAPAQAPPLENRLQEMAHASHRSGHSGCDRVAGLSRAGHRCTARRAAVTFPYARRCSHVSSRQCRVGSRRALGHSGGRLDRNDAPGGEVRAAPRPDCRVGSRNGVVPRALVAADSRRRRHGHRRDGLDAARHAVVHPV